MIFIRQSEKRTLCHNENLFMTYFTLNSGDKISEEGLAQIKKAAAFSVSFDADSPELTDEQLSAIRQAYLQAKENDRLESVSLRLKHRTVIKAKSLGSGYTSIIARVIEKVLDNPEWIRMILSE